MLAQTFFAQELTLGVELRPRYEYRNGYNTLLDNTQNPVSFVSQRSRLNLGLYYDNLSFVVKAQDIRVWGDVATNQSQKHSGLSIFEGYAQYHLDSIWNFRIGRQVLSYDNQRIFGEVNWAQQGRSHDALLVLIRPNKKQELHIGASVSSNAETTAQSAYSVNNYKNMQLLWYQYRFEKSKLSALFLNNGYEFETDQQNLKTQYMQTFGVFYRFKSYKWFGEVSTYKQTGTQNNLNISGWYGSITLGFLPSENWEIVVGTEYLSGTAMDDTSKTNKSFNPLFGTNHKFNGFMDYFYVGNHINSVGLMDIYAQLKFKKNRFSFNLLPHLFFSAEKVWNASESMDNYLGTEIDIVATYKLHKYISAELGYSQLFGSQTMDVLKEIDSNRCQNWTWVMVTVKPQIFSFKK